MKKRNFADSFKNAMGTVFLLAGAFFVCSTFLSMRSVLADPIAPVAQNNVITPQATRAGNTSRTSRPATSRGNSANIVSRGNATTTVTSPRGTTASRSVVSRTTTTPTVAAGTATASSRVATSGRPTMMTSRGNTTTTARPSASGASRNVVSRTTTTTASRVAANNPTRSVRSRTTTNPSRISLQGSAIRGSYATNSNTYTYLQNRLYTGNYSNIIDSSTGLISAEAYNNCMESYYACMDEICTARNAAQRRCACAGRVRAFADAEAKLEQANEELIKVSGELALLIATKGKDISAAFQLTDAEKVMNCVSWQEITSQYGESSDEAVEWCYNHGFYDSNGGGMSPCTKPSYCTSDGNSFGFDISNISGGSSDILASLQSWADAKEKTLTILDQDNDNILEAFENLTDVVGNLAGIGNAIGDTESLKDSLAETWGYELFEYAHNNVCNRVLDSCFNGIYEACGTPPSGGTKCGNGRSQCPYNYNSYISVSNTGDYSLNFITPDTGYTSSNSATCFGYSSASGDPYADLRGPVADARRSIMQKYALDANADCDAYGEQLTTTAQNIGYQKAAAQQALQQKRLEFYQEEQETMKSDYDDAISNFTECLSELYDCYETQAKSESGWTDARIKTYCAQVANVPHCYEQMVCNPSDSQISKVISLTDSKTCNNTQDVSKNTCRNVVTLNEILNGVTGGDGDTECTGDDLTQCNSAVIRENCLLENWASEIRDWTKQ